jgi:hypothetical protein
MSGTLSGDGAVYSKTHLIVPLRNKFSSALHAFIIHRLLISLEKIFHHTIHFLMEIYPIVTLIRRNLGLNIYPCLYYHFEFYLH